MRRNLTPSASAAALPDSVTAAASLAGTYTVAVVFAGTVMFQWKVLFSIFQSLLMRPWMES